jgi:hypothetical protein
VRWKLDEPEPLPGRKDAPAWTSTGARSSTGYSMTCSACSITNGGTVRPNAFAGCHLSMAYEWIHGFNASGFTTFAQAPNPKGRPRPRRSRAFTNKVWPLGVRSIPGMSRRALRTAARSRKTTPRNSALAADRERERDQDVAREVKDRRGDQQPGEGGGSTNDNCLSNVLSQT